MQALVRAQKQFGGARQAARVINTPTGAFLPIPTVNDTSNVASAVAEAGSRSELDIVFGQDGLHSYCYNSGNVIGSATPNMLLLSSGSNAHSSNR